MITSVRPVGAGAPDRTQVAAADPAVQAAIYPQIVAVTRLLVSPYWRGKAHQNWPHPKEFIHELRRTAAPNFHWSLEYPLGPRDRLIKILLDDPCPAGRRPTPDYRIEHRDAASIRQVGSDR